MNVHLLSWAGIRYRLPVDAVTLLFAARSLFGLGQLLFSSGARREKGTGLAV